MLAPQLLGALRGKNPAAAWDAGEEAKRYREEAEWALRWQRVPEAIVALDAAWALGLRLARLSLPRMITCGPGWSSPAACWFSVTAAGVVCGRFRKPGLPLPSLPSRAGAALGFWKVVEPRGFEPLTS
jgi:hypothetical protein